MEQNNHPNWNRYIALRELTFTGSASAQETAELEQLVLSDPLIKRNFTEVLHQESALGFQNAETANSTWVDNKPIVQSSTNRISILRFTKFAVATSVLFAIGVGLFQLLEMQQHVVVIGSVQNCTWDQSSIATTPGIPLPPGRFVLATGIAVINFKNVDLTMEGPADVEILNATRCFVRSGRVYAEVYPGGEGFVVETPTSTLIDRGTRFGVNVTPQGTTELSVLQGRVDGTHKMTGEQVSVIKDSSLRFTDAGTENLRAVAEFASSDATEAEQVKVDRTIQISTAVGSGRDAYVMASSEGPDKIRPNLLLVKETIENDGQMNAGFYNDWRRHAYLHFDLTTVATDTIRTAKLQLQGAATDIGYLSFTPDTVFAVYGITDESLEAWTEDEIQWSQNIGMMSDGIHVDKTSTVLLGEFVVPTSLTTSTSTLQSDELIEFLEQDTNGGASLILVAKTSGSYVDSYVHGFASKRHPELSPPTLRLGLVDAKTNKDAQN